MRVPVIAGNWKMNNTIDEAVNLVLGIQTVVPFPKNVEVVVAPSFLCLPAVIEKCRNSYIGVSAQNLFWEDKGAFTGEVSAAMLKSAGCEYVIIGHSERRQYFGETD